MINKNIFEFPISYSTVVGRIGVGWGVHETVADECMGLGITHALTTTTGLKATGVVDEIGAILNHQGISTTVFSNVSSNPKDYQIMEAYKAYKEAGCNGVVSVGGGSSHDCGKGVRAVSSYGGLHIREMSARTNPDWLERVRNSPPVNIPQVCVNTTAGSWPRRDTPMGSRPPCSWPATPGPTWQ